MTEAQQALLTSTAKEIISEFLAPFVVAGLKGSDLYEPLQKHVELKLLKLHGALREAEHQPRI